MYNFSSFDGGVLWDFPTFLEVLLPDLSLFSGVCFGDLAGCAFGLLGVLNLPATVQENISLVNQAFTISTYSLHIF